MPRIRTIKPEFFASEDVSDLPIRARLTWIGLWTHCDDHGRTKDQVKLIKAAVWPLDDFALREVEEDLDLLAAKGRIVRYEVDGTRYLAVVNWHYHQSINKSSKPKYPPPPEPVGAPEPDEPGFCEYCYYGSNTGFPDTSGSPPGLFPESSGSPTGGLPLGKEQGVGNREQGTRARANGRKQPAIPLPESWEPNEKHRAIALKHGLDLDVQVQRFRDHADANDRRQCRWDAAFNQWLSHAVEWSTPRRLQAVPPTNSDSPWAGVVAR
jgi:hypothetical protein